MQPLSQNHAGIYIDEKHLVEALFTHASIGIIVANSNIQGTGLGLHIVARYAGLMKGNISCESMLGEGTTMTVTFKLEKQPAEETETDTSPWN